MAAIDFLTRVKGVGSSPWEEGYSGLDTMYGGEWSIMIFRFWSMVCVCDTLMSGDADIVHMCVCAYVCTYLHMPYQTSTGFV